MKKISLVSLLLLSVMLVACSNNTPPNGLNPLTAAEDCSETTLDGGWVCVWADEFEGDAVDTEKWTYEVNGNGGGNNELQYYTDQNTEVKDSILSIIAKKESYLGREYTSSRIVSKYKGDFTFARVIVRAKNPVGGGTWPAIWMMPTMSVYGGWPKSGEIDIMEYVGNRPTKVSGTVHTEARNGGDTPVREYSLPTANTEFHNYEVIWRPGSIQWFVDGVKFNEVVYAPAFTQQYEYKQVFPFDQMFFMILNLAIGGTLGGEVDNSIFPTAFEVDYVRVYQKDYATVDKSAPTKVEDIKVQQLANSIYWQSAQDDTDVKRYAIYVDGTFKGYSNLNQYTLKNLNPGQSYEITIEAEDFTGRVSKMSDPFTFVAS
jgi:beta-glucanase (GH16 family)